MKKIMRAIFVFAIVILTFSCNSWEKEVEKETEIPSFLFEQSELLLPASACDTIVQMTKLLDEPHCFISDIYDDGYGEIDTLVTTYKFSEPTDTIRAEWFSVVLTTNKLLINVQPNDSVDSRQFRVLYMIVPELKAFIVTQRGATRP